MSECKWEKGGSKKYRLTSAYHDQLKVKPKVVIITNYCLFRTTGELVIGVGYEWDGPSGPAIDTDNFMDGSLVHDLLYQLMREGHFKKWPHRLYADNEMWRQIKKDKMHWLRRAWCWLGVRIGGYWSAR